MQDVKPQKVAYLDCPNCKNLGVVTNDWYIVNWTWKCSNCLSVLSKDQVHAILSNLKPDNDPVSHPHHYTNHPSGIECIQITEHMNFCLGNAVKYIWRADLKQDAVEDLRKARWYLDREISRRTGDAGLPTEGQSSSSGKEATDFSG